MIKLKGTGENTILYECDCGIEGKCLIKPLSNGPCVVNIKCPVCSAMVQIVLARDNEEYSDISWAYVAENKILDYKLNGE